MHITIVSLSSTVYVSLTLSEHQGRVYVIQPIVSCGNYTGWPKNWHHVLYALTLPNINRFSKLGENL